ncbi:MAG: chloride channel protein [Polyangiaceae bacterium]|nr:chloride channel protein [Polyangiaceae bacterium]MCL4749717.1 chloride channel protein [Myxococcales bacterium]
MPRFGLASAAQRLRELLNGPRLLVPLGFAERAPLDFRFLGRALIQAALVGLAAGLAGAAFFAALEYLSRLLLEDLAGYVPVRARGEQFAASGHGTPFRPWLLVLIPALGGLGAGLVARWVPEVRGGGADPTIEAFHYRGGMLRRRLIWAKPLASLFTLGTGGAGGREGPTMLIGGAIGSSVARALGLSARERRILLVAGVAAGISAVFRTPLGAALLAVELLYRDGFESDALIPSVLSSVTAYSVVISIFGESTLFTHAPRFPFVPAHLPLYGLLALVVASVAVGFLAVFGATRRGFSKLPLPEWLRPALGGLALGILATAAITLLGAGTTQPGQGLGILGGGYGAVQAAISGASWLPLGWNGVLLLVGLALLKIFASSLTIGSGGSAGDFAPSLAIGGLLGGAFGRAAQLLLHDPRIDPGAFALVGMGAFYAGIAHVPLAALVLVCELAGNYDLLVPLMLALGISFVVLRKKGIYEAQVATLADSPVHRDAIMLDMLRTAHVSELMVSGRPFASFSPGSSAQDVIDKVGDADWQNVFPVVDAEQRLLGLVTSEAAHVLAQQADDARWTIVADMMQPAVWVRQDDDLHTATKALVESGLRELPVVDAERRVIGFLDEADIAKLHLSSATRAEAGPG